MSLNLDPRQRAMLAEMGVRVWQRPPTELMPAPTTARHPTALAPAPTPQRSSAAPMTPARMSAPTNAPQSSAAAVESMNTHGAPMSWPVLRQTIASCQACGLCVGRRAAVLGAAPDQGQSHWIVVGEPPHELEERDGQPFVGAAGQLLDNMLKAINARRGATGPAGAYLTNIVKCRPATPRNPTAQDLASCALHLQQEIALVQPRLILALGRFAAQSLLQASMPDVANVPLGKLRGQVHRYNGIPVVVSYHPAYLLRSQADKAKAWADLCLAMDTLDAPPTNSF